MNKEMSLDVALDIIGTLRMMKIDEISEEKDENRKKILQKVSKVESITEIEHIINFCFVYNSLKFEILKPI